jgi:hypothetical protein
MFNPPRRENAPDRRLCDIYSCAEVLVALFRIHGGLWTPSGWFRVTSGVLPKDRGDGDATVNQEASV